MPSPQDELCRLLGSPEPTHTMERSEGAIAMSPTVETPALSKTGSQVVPLLTVFQTPPEATPAKTMSGFDSTTAKSSMRPPITAGPSSRNSSDLNLSMTEGSAAAVSAGAAFLSSFGGLGFCARSPLVISSIPQRAAVIRLQFLDISPPQIRFVHRSLRVLPKPPLPSPAANHSASGLSAQHRI